MPIAGSMAERTRAYVLIRAEAKAPLISLAQAIREMKAGDSSVVLRADLVAGPHDVVASVDAESSGALLAIVGEIRALDGVRETLTLVVAVLVPGSPLGEFPLAGENPWG